MSLIEAFGRLDRRTDHKQSSSAPDHTTAGICNRADHPLRHRLQGYLDRRRANEHAEADMPADHLHPNILG